MYRTTARALRGIYIALNHVLGPEARAVANDILLQLAETMRDGDVATLYKSILENVSGEEERDPLPRPPQRPKLVLVH
jgi:hypothetical protein